MGCRVLSELCDLVCIEQVQVGFDGLWLTSDESRMECIKTWSSYDKGRQLVPGYYCAW